ncbi:MAG: recombination protein NinB [Telluria sp.]
MQRTFVLRELAHLTSLIGFLSSNWQVFAREGKFLAVTVSLYKSKRSLEQNRRYFGPAVLGAIEEQVWVQGRRHDKESWHEYFKRRFLGVVDLPFGGTRAMSSTDLNVEEFALFMQQVEAYAASELGVVFD